MKNFLRQIFKPKYKTFNRLEINAENLLHNWRYLKSVQPTSAIFPVLKSNAYGHGLREVCQVLDRTETPMVAVDSYPEAQIVYDYFRAKVLILGEMPPQAYRHCRLDRTEFVVYNEKTLRLLAGYGKRARIHLFLNTGMNREGIDNLPAFMERNREYLAAVEVSGFCSHLASAETDSPLNAAQEERFARGLAALRQAGFFPRWIHLGNSAGVFTLRNKLLTAFRPGLAFYGYNPFPPEAGRELPLKPALELYSQLIAVHELSAGESVSYTETYRVQRPTTIGLMPFGYFEGLDRRLSNKAQFKLFTPEGQSSCRVAGQVSMNLCCLEIGQNKANIGEDIQIISADPAAFNSAANLARLSGTIVYELLVKLQASIRREVI